MTAPALKLSIRFPIPDLRSDPERGPWFKKSLQKEILHLEFTDIEFKTEFTGGPTPEQVKLELTFKELTGKIKSWYTCFWFSLYSCGNMQIQHRGSFHLCNI